MNNSYMPLKATVSKPSKTHKHRMANYAQTSTAFMQSSVLFKKLFKGNSNLNINYDAFVRLESMPNPTMGLANMKLNWFYVPQRVIFKNWREFITQSLCHGKTSAEYCNYCPTFDIADFWKYCFTNRNTLGLYTVKGRIDQEAPDPYIGTDYDAVVELSGVIRAIKFSYKGFCMFNLFHQLGYAIPGYDVQNTRITKSAMPLLAYAKIVLDYYIPKQWRDFEYLYNSIYRLFETQDINATLGPNEVLDILSLVFYVAYDNDFNTEAWNSPAGPNSTSSYPSITLHEDLYDQNDIDASSAGAFLTLANRQIMQEDLNQLMAFDKILKKNQIVGVKSWDRLMARFGIKTDKALMNISEIIESKEVPIILSEVIATAETAANNSGANLGDLAGKGEAFINDECNFSYFAEESGYLMCIATIIPEVGYANYEDEDVNAIECLDFYNEELDGVYTQPCPATCVLNAEMGFREQDLEDVWGWYPSYYWMKVTKPRISGKYSLYSRKAENKSWTFLRWLDYLEITSHSNTLDFGIGTNFTMGNTVYNYRTQFDDIFYFPNEHNFNIFFTHDILMTNTMKPLWDYSLLTDEDGDDEKDYKVKVQTHI